ncbi:MAG: hypothetical protein EOO93_08225 [Pedobacter sp.]|nr:MAG: hypothetical protein EOO93_08225 [Pedobacter sp.]
MKNLYIYLLGIFTLTACKAQVLNQELIYGTFYNGSRNLDFNYKYKLQLNADGSFFLIEKHKDGNPQCEGHWKRIDQNIILLKCNEVNVTEMLSNRYMSKREYKLEIVDRNKIKYNGILLKRIK